MNLFTPDLWRNFTIGFLVGAFALGAANAASFEADSSYRGATPDLVMERAVR